MHDYNFNSTCVACPAGKVRAAGRHPEGPEALSARCSTVETEVIAEVPFATPTMQAVQDSWMGLVSRRAVGVWVFVAISCKKASRGPLSVLSVS
jgi:hypothetical protein